MFQCKKEEVFGVPVCNCEGLRTCLNCGTILRAALFAFCIYCLFVGLSTALLHFHGSFTRFSRALGALSQVCVCKKCRSYAQIEALGKDRLHADKTQSNSARVTPAAACTGSLHQSAAAVRRRRWVLFQHSSQELLCLSLKLIP